MVCSSKTIKLF